MDSYYDFIIKELSAGTSRKDVYRKLKEKGYHGGQSAAYDYMNKIIEKIPYRCCNIQKFYGRSNKKKKTLQKYDHLSRNGIFRYLWMNAELTEVYVNYLMQNYPVLRKLLMCVREFREIYQRRSMPLLYLFINKYKTFSIKELSRFAMGLEKDLDAVENSVASSFSNGFVEGTNSKLNMVKRTMYGRCNKALLEVKMMYGKVIFYG